MNRILFAGGGTAGHIEPAWACGQSWQRKHPGDEIAYLGTKSGLEATVIPERNGVLYLIPKVTAPRKMDFNSLLFPLKLMKSITKTISIVRRFEVVVGFGGYVAASAYIAAAILRKPIVIHEQNAKAGLANRFGALFAKEIAVAYEIATNELHGARVVGNPLREEIVIAAQKAELDWKSARAKAKAKLGIDDSLVLILGGSLGSQSINRVIAETKFTNCTVIHSVGRENQLPKESPNYRPVSYIDDMATVLLAADLVISRSGAIATTEFAALGKYALFIPLPIGNGEQELNAEELIKAGRAELINQKDFNSVWLSENLARLLRKGRDEAFGTPLNAADQIVECIAKVLP